MNDRSQGGSADLSEKSTIELMQQRRHSTTDGFMDIQESLNETTKEQYGVKVNAQYNMQIFNFEKGDSKQRSQ
jgi:plasmid maintenance system killer protein